MRYNQSTPPAVKPTVRDRSASAGGPANNKGGAVREVLRSNDAVVISFAQAILQELGIANFVADQHMSVAEGSIGVFPRRLLVHITDEMAARRALTQAGLDVWLVKSGEAEA